MKFHPVINSWFVERFGRASPPQEQGWPVISVGQHTLILAPTGSGKTLAAFLWCLDDLFRSGLQGPVRGVHTLYISPLKALNNDIHRNLDEPLRGIRAQALAAGIAMPEITKVVRTGDTPSNIRQAIMRNPPHILITTPESLYLLLTSVRGRELFHNLRYLIVDEIHALCGNKRGVHLSLSIERLMTLCDAEPVRIGLSATQRPLDRIAAFLGGRFSAVPYDGSSSMQAKEDSRTSERPVTVVDCGQRKALDLQVISPVKKFSELPESTVWPAVIKTLYELIKQHKSTLVFVNMRAQTEKIARLLNEMEISESVEQQTGFALAHHGSISREVRYDIEARLKAGEIPAVIATGSLELGIDIGSIDLVVQLEAPRTVSGSLQRVGRSGHLLSAVSKGRIIPMYPSDLDDAVALAGAMADADIEETVIPENCLDVLAQQLVAEVAMRDWPRAELFSLVRRSYCYRQLSSRTFDNVLEMLSGKFSDIPLKSLRARLTWDRVNDLLVTRRGSRLLATMNGGTIPDRGYYGVYLAGSNVKLGEMEEEFVFESRVGHVFFLGNNEWRIDAIDQHRITVSPVRAIKPRAPFWKGDILYRDFDTSRKIGAFRRMLLGQMESADGQNYRESKAWLCSLYPVEETIAQNLLDYLQRQRRHSTVLPTDRLMVAEWFKDSADEPHLVIHTCFGARVNGALALALAAAFEVKLHMQVQYSIDDDGMIFRISDVDEPVALPELFNMPFRELESLLFNSLADSPIFAIRFRYNAARALILTRSQPNKRIPLWLQRLRAADLLQAVREHPDFPILIETYRDCLEDVFDLKSLRAVIEQYQNGEIALQTIRTPYPSPMASGLMFDFLSNNLYEVDRSRYPAQVAEISSELLSEIIAAETIPAIIAGEDVQEAEAHWQHLSRETRARDQEDLYQIIERLAPIDDHALTKRSGEDPAVWLKALHDKGRIIYHHGAAAGWIPVSESDRFQAMAQEDNLREQIARLLSSRGPMQAAEIAAHLGLAVDLLTGPLRRLLTEKRVVHGFLLEGQEKEYWCDRENFSQMYRRAIAKRRAAIKPAGREQFYEFSLRWQRIGDWQGSVVDLARRYAGYRLPVAVFEREILRSRYGVTQEHVLADLAAQFGAAVADGEIIARIFQDGPERHIRCDYIPRGEAGLFTTRQEMQAKSEHLGENPAAVYTFLKENGASPVTDIIRGTGLRTAQINDSLAALTKAGIASCENYNVFTGMIKSNAEVRTGADRAGTKAAGNTSWLPAELPAWKQKQRHNMQRRHLRTRVDREMQLQNSRWFLLQSFAVLGPELDDDEMVERQTSLLLERYGLLVKEWYRQERGHQQVKWHRIFRTLKRLEWQGKVRRGYFVDGLSGVQFALPEAVEMLEKIQTGKYKTADDICVVSSADPALPLGGMVDWGLLDMTGSKISVVRSFANHIVFQNMRPVYYMENFASRIRQIKGEVQRDQDRFIDAIKVWLKIPPHLRPRKRLQIERIDEQAAAFSQIAPLFIRNGFEQDGDKLVLWPSGV